MSCEATAALGALSIGVRYAVCYTDFRHRSRKRIFRQLGRAQRWANKLRMGSRPEIRVVYHRTELTKQVVSNSGGTK